MQPAARQKIRRDKPNRRQQLLQHLSLSDIVCFVQNVEHITASEGCQSNKVHMNCMQIERRMHLPTTMVRSAVSLGSHSARKGVR